MARPKGALNRRTREALHKAKENDLDANGHSAPIRYLLRVMEDTRNDDDRRDRAAIAVSPFLQPKLSAIDLTQQPPAPKSEEVLLAEMAELIRNNPDLARAVQEALGTNQPPLPKAGEEPE